MLGQTLVSKEAKHAWFGLNAHVKDLSNVDFMAFVSLVSKFPCTSYLNAVDIAMIAFRFRAL